MEKHPFSDLQPFIPLLMNCTSSFGKDFIYLFSERGEGRGKERERNINVREKHQLAASHMTPSRDLAHNPGMCTDWESNQQLFGSQAGTQSIEPHLPGLKRGGGFYGNK